ncbi:LysR family transcriptional regulator ArgP [Arthrobacter cavernae]|uniref:LysR family transcriptional regulator ArgP n=1 Tax=Arthrobacter cavernae TaxID=2817681 RepID=A0A939KJB3_9MICC|nr:LysR family transcriptional regulator ArgP [Arthrobacter cavernae]MBO1267539.1 LysR family transcriptional regulator ArgP [Arthrobacter cavernae]
MTRFPSEQLLTFATVLSEGTLEAAARLLHITPSAVSQRLKALEQSAGRVLLQRSNPVQATEAGEVVLRLARQLAQLEADAGAELGLPAGPGHVAVPVVVNADSLAVWFLKALVRVPKDLGVTFDLHRDDEQHSTSLLRSGTVMAAVTATPEPVQGCRVEGLGVMRYRAVAAPEFVDRWLPGGIHPHALNAAPAVDFDRKDSYQRKFLETLLGSPVAVPGPRHYVPATQDFADAIRLGLGWGLVPEIQCGPDLDAGRLVELAPDRPFDVALYWQRWRTPSRMLDALSAAVRDTAADYLLKP